ncbi:MAG TPA: hypothetical protein VGJ57_03170 [Nitrospirales bacterium]
MKNQLADPIPLTEFRKQLREVVARHRQDWSSSRRLVSPHLACETIQRLTAALPQSGVDPALREALLSALLPGETGGVKAVSGEVLRRITGLNPTKAIRNLCLFLGLHHDPVNHAVLLEQAEEGSTGETIPVSELSQQQVEAAARATDNPFDLLLAADVPSVVDFGAGDLTFEEQLVAGYLARLEAAEKTLTLHCLDRLDPAAEAGSLVRAGKERLQWLGRHPSKRLQFQFFSNQDMFAMQQIPAAPPRYTVAVCHSPASPTFAYEPTRISTKAIEQRLRETKGEFRRVTRGGQELLEVRHGNEWLTFPSWKFDIYGPLALLDLLSRHGKLCVIGAVDTEVFWEILSQLLPQDSARPREVFYTEENVPKYFGPVYDTLAQLPVGGRMVLATPRQDIPRVLGPEGERLSYGFRYVEIRRGALFSGMPAGRTAYVFEQMTRETAPWFLTLVPSI